jgi:glycosyltransferase involved in cell wall biosynthesis
MMLCKLVAGMDRSRFESTVVSLGDEGTLGAQILDCGAKLYALRMRPGMLSCRPLLSLFRLVKSYQPDVVQTWLYHSNPLGLIAARVAGVPNVCWSLHSCNPEMRGYPWMTRVIVRLLAVMSPLPSGVIAVSMVSKSWHEAQGYGPKRWIYIPIGIDVQHFRPRIDANTRLKEQLGLSPETFLIGMVARYHPLKDHLNFLRGLALVSRDCPAVHAVLMGRGIEPGNPDLCRAIEELKVKNLVHLLGERADVPDLMAGFDLLCSTSNSEASPNVLGEAMACEVPCVVTDVGDCARIVGNTGTVVPPRDHQALARAIMDLFTAGPDVRRRLGADARRRVSTCFSLLSVVQAYEKLYSELSGVH